MLIIPAIDLKGGKCVRLLRGDLQAETVYGVDPVAMGRRWADAGARYLHVVDLDGAVSGAPVNGDAIAALCATLSIPVQVGGGVRTVERAGAILAMGADRVIFGTAALEQPEVVADACRRFPDRVAVGIDARGGKVAVKGWLETSATSAVAVARRLEGAGVACIIYTDIEALLPCEAAGVTGVIVGRALYTGAVRLEDALRLVAANPRTLGPLNP